jgi:hypothetical protein
MDELLARIVDAHGGMDRWKGYERVDAMIVSGGGLFPLKGLTQDPNPRRMSVWLMDGVQAKETEPWREGSEFWRVMRAYFPGSIETHSFVQDFFFGEDLMLRRHDYSVNIAGGFGAAQLTSD